jgi:putative effector of murein hydrolase
MSAMTHACGVTIFVRSQVVVWVASPAMIRAGSTTAVMTVLLVAFLLEYLPKIYHSVRVLRRMQDVSGYLFGTIWWGIALNLMAYFVAAHVSRPVRPLSLHPILTDVSIKAYCPLEDGLHISVNSSRRCMERSQ